MQEFSLSIRFWFRQNSRSLPWRETKDPYFIWLSEIILQQTRVEQGRSYYEKFVRHFPTVKDLAASKEEKVLNLWQGLGYYSRARNLHYASQQVMNEFGGAFPTTYKEIKSLKGVGDYTAAAIASFAFDLPHAVVDGNVYRVLARYYADPTPIDSTKGKKLFTAYAQELISEEDPAEFNQAIMELGALVCKPKNPLCHDCPLQDSCAAFRQGDQEDYPVKEKKTKVRNRYFHYLFTGKDAFYLEKRAGKGIWQNLYQLPLIETEKKASKRVIDEKVAATFDSSISSRIATYTHVLSHQKIHATFWQVTPELTVSKDWVAVDIQSVNDYPLPRLIHRFLEEKVPGYEES